MKERPLLFTATMVRAILSGEKTVTRRVIGLPEMQVSTTPGYDWTWRGQAPIRSVAQQRKHPLGCWQDVRHADLLALCPYGGPGDTLWCREAWAAWFHDDVAGQFDWKLTPREKRTRENCTGIAYRATVDPITVDRWVTPRFMPRWASRLTLRVTGVRVERLHDITDAEAEREGIGGWSKDGVLFKYGPSDAEGNGPIWPWADCPRSPRDAFERLWTEINGRASWASNPIVWCVDFEREK